MLARIFLLEFVESGGSPVVVLFAPLMCQKRFHLKIIMCIVILHIVRLSDDKLAVSDIHIFSQLVKIPSDAAFLSLLLKQSLDLGLGSVISIIQLMLSHLYYHTFQNRLLYAKYQCPVYNRKQY